jgi:hypothetical protein
LITINIAGSVVQVVQGGCQVVEGGVFAYCIKIQAQRWGVNGVDRAYIRFHTGILREEHR